MMISRETIERVKHESRIVDIVQESVPLKRKGAYYTACCPFHSERTPSFFVKDQTNTYNCFGCGESGNVISFVMATKAMSFPETVEYLANRFNIPVVHDKKGNEPALPAQNRNEVLKALSLAQRYFQSAFQRLREETNEFRILREYVLKRKLTRESVQAFQIGYAPQAHGLVAVLKREGISEESIIHSGLARRSHSGELYDLFRGRLMFPIFIDQKNIIAFGGRLVPGMVSKEQEKELPKYLNSPESIVYHKSKALFGLPQAMQEARARKEIYLVEGYMDVIGLWQAGVQNVVASCGTAVTADHFRRLASVSSKIKILLDGDDAGRSAASRSFEPALNCEADLEVVFLPDGKDPDDLARENPGNARDAIDSLLKRAPVEVWLEGLLKQHGLGPKESPGPNVLGKLTSVIAQILQKVTSSVVRENLTMRAARKLGIEKRELDVLLGSGRGDLRPKPGTGIEISTEELTPIEREVVLAVSQTKGEGAHMVLKQPGIEDLLSYSTLSILEALSTALTLEDREQVSEQVRNIVKQAGPQWIKLWKQAHEMMETGDVNATVAMNLATQSLAKTKKDRAVIALKREVPHYADDPVEQAKLVNQILELRKQSVMPGRVE